MSDAIHVDVVVLGSGFGGTLTALIAKQLGLSVALIDRGTHPRFAVGESSTPLADRLLGELAGRYDLPYLQPLTTYGSWKRTYPNLNVGLKRGFTYLRHRRGQSFSNGHGNPLLVAASESDEQSDTHWYRLDFDYWLVRQAEQAGIDVVAGLYAKIEHSADGWRFVDGLGDRPTYTSKLAVDASGARGVIAGHLGVQPVPDTEFLTHSAAVFGHWDSLPPVGSFEGISSTESHPFDLDGAAVHHVLDEGWMWQLRFDRGQVSIGVCFDGEDQVAPEWLAQTAFQYPSLGMQIAQSAGPITDVQATGRLQRRLEAVAGEDWVALPHTIGFVDPLHSTGIALTLGGIAKFARVLEKWQPGQPPSEADWGMRPVVSELQRIDRLVALGYRTRRQPRAFEAAVLLYTLCAMTSETAGAGDSPRELFVDPGYSLDETIERCLDLVGPNGVSSDDDSTGEALLLIVREAAHALEINALDEPPTPGLYARTATKR